MGLLFSFLPGTHPSPPCSPPPPQKKPFVYGGPECPICLQRYAQPPQRVIEMAIYTQCRHMLHTACYNAYKSNVCPVCRTESPAQHVLVTLAPFSESSAEKKE